MNKETSGVLNLSLQLFELVIAAAGSHDSNMIHTIYFTHTSRHIVLIHNKECTKALNISSQGEDDSQIDMVGNK